jgi:hypothetical protein
VARITIEDCLREDIVIALREIAAGRFSIEGKEYEEREKKRRVEMAKSEREKVTTKKTQTTARKTTVKKSAPKKTAKKLASQEGPVRTTGIKKEYLEGGKLCKVTFRLPSIAAPSAKSVCIVGDFNNWNIHGNRMKKLKNGDYCIILNLVPGREYEFRYFIDESKWENDWNADKYVKSPLGDSDNSVIEV